MFETFIYAGLTLIVSFCFGAGISFLILPPKLHAYRLWLSPWIFFFTVILTLILFSFIGISTSQVAPYLLFVLFLINLYVFRIKKEIYFIDWEYDIFLALSSLTSIVFNISPIIKKIHLLTTISLGNNDVVAYATAADYLVHYSIPESFYTNVALPVEDLFHLGGRWGPPILESFFLFIFNLRGYQFTYIFEVIIYALMIPLVYVLFQILYKKSYTAMVLLNVILIFNVNFLYILYHNFFGVVMFWGISLFLLIGTFIYLTDDKIESQALNRHDLLLIISYSVLYACYHEGIVFITAPLLLYVGYRILFKKNLEIYSYKLLKILCGVFLFSAISVINAIVFDYVQAFGGYRGGEIGWQVFRIKIPYANPFEMLGFYSIHSFEPLPLPIAILLSLFVVAITLYGLLKLRGKVLLSLYFLIFLVFLYWAGPYSKHFFNYNRVVVYTLPFFIILFVTGFTAAIDKRKKIWIIAVILLCLEVYSGLKLNKKFLQEFKAVGKPFISLQTGPFTLMNETVYTSNYISESVPIWNTVWTEYFIYPVIGGNKNSVPEKISDNSLILTAKSTTWTGATRPLYKEIIWENEYFRLGRICKVNECLLKTKKDLSVIQIGNNDYEDTLFMNGWDKREGNARWANNIEATVKLITKEFSEEVIVEAVALEEPQSMKIYINEVLAGELVLSKEWKKQSVKLIQPIPPGIHLVTFKFSQMYIPDNILHNRDIRSLAAQFKLIKLE